MKLITIPLLVFFCLFILLQPSFSKAQCSSSEVSITAGWPKSYGGTGNDGGWDIAVIDLDNNPNTYDGYVAVGGIDKGTEGSNVYVLRVNESGGVEFETDFDGGTDLDDVAYAVEQTSTDNIIICGVTTVTESGSPRKEW